MMKTKNKMQVFCMYCGRGFWKKRFPKKATMRNSYIRTSTSLTCSPECSKNLTRLRITGVRK